MDGREIGTGEENGAEPAYCPLPLVALGPQAGSVPQFDCGV